MLKRPRKSWKFRNLRCLRLWDSHSGKVILGSIWTRSLPTSSKKHVKTANRGPTMRCKKSLRSRTTLKLQSQPFIHGKEASAAKAGPTRASIRKQDQTWERSWAPRIGKQARTKMTKRVRIRSLNCKAPRAPMHHKAWSFNWRNKMKLSCHPKQETPHLNKYLPQPSSHLNRALLSDTGDT